MVSIGFIKMDDYTPFWSCATTSTLCVRQCYTIQNIFPTIEKIKPKIW